jgi:hypothetical protein
MGRRDAGNSPYACLRACRVNAQREITESIRVAEPPRQNAMEQRDSPARNEQPNAMLNPCYPAQ